MARSYKPCCGRTHHYRYLAAKKEYRVLGNRSTRHHMKQLLRETFDPEEVIFPHPKIDAFDRWALS